MNKYEQMADIDLVNSLIRSTQNASGAASGLIIDPAADVHVTRLNDDKNELLRRLRDARTKVRMAETDD